MDLRDYFKVFGRRWRLVLACALVAVAAATLVTLASPLKYTSTVRLFVSTSQPDLASAYQGGLFSEQRVASYADLVTGPELARRVVDRLGFERSPAALRKQISASVVPNTVILVIKVTDRSPQTAGRIAQALADEFTSFVKQLESSSAKSGTPIKVTSLGPPITPRAPVSPQPIRNVAAGVAVGLLLGAGVAGVREALDSTLRKPEEVAELASAPVLGSFSYDTKVSKRLLTDYRSHAPRVEAFRVLRTNLQFINVDQRSKVFVVTSSLPGEGKTTTATNLAIALAQSGQRIVLVDGDLRRPGVADSLGLEAKVGLTSALIGRVALVDAIQDWGTDGLAVLASGPMPPDPTQLLQSRAMADVLNDLRRAFDIVLIDAPPLLPVADAAILSAQAEGALLVVRHGKTTRDQIRACVERLGSVHAHIAGSVLNMCPHRGPNGVSYSYSYAGPAGDDVPRPANGKVLPSASTRIAEPVGSRPAGDGGADAANGVG
ncbi:polysaccharide biosynthesis tyrosine autokinase [Actinopolymorpha sp. NPDC004070]|uniref:polysaccharide biosynthesis tyrosine autokinase n=1 Tax=Actinopolymorpha sp. NPDC004070 TaxID=3154548 RepID=UPI00339F5026